MAIKVYYHLLFAYFISILVTVISVSFVKAPYGRYQRPGWGTTINNRYAWIIMESPSVIVFALVFLLNIKSNNAVSIFFFVLWQSHYIYRTFIYPIKIRGKNKVMPVTVVLMAITFNTINSFLNAFWLTHFANYTLQSFMQFSFIVGVTVFVAGFYIHVRADQVLINLRKVGETTYKIPEKFLYRWICSPNYLGEIIEWSGFALATMSLPAVAFALYTAANLIPRAHQHLTWYRSQFSNYPKARKAIIPYLW